MTDQTVNIPLLRKAVEWAEAEAAKPLELCEWRQDYWVTPATGAEASAWGIWASGQTATVGKAAECGTCYCIAGYVVASQRGAGRYDDGEGLDQVAADLLGLTSKQHQRLFRATNSIDMVRRIAEDIAGERL